jgi:predicted DCC family thiol-disulfide oxidoreductase YuxK
MNTTALENTASENPLTRSTEGWDVEVFFDGGCPLCLREINMLQRRDVRHRIRFTDIDRIDFNAEVLGKSRQELMERIHGRLPDGSWIQGVEVFRRLYAAVGFSTLVQLTRLPGISQILQLGYVIFAKNRLRLTGRCTSDSCDLPVRAAVRTETKTASPGTFT